ncbi:MAG: hypothetical protein WCR52_24340 [Bacteroidota bacterium]
MQDLIELVNLFQKTKFRSGGLKNLVLEQGSQMERLYEAIADGNLRSDEEIVRVLPEIAGAHSKMYAVKNKFKERLLDSLLLLDFKEPSFSDRQKAFYECSKKWASAMVLFSKGARSSALDLLESLLRHTIRFEFTEITLDILRALRLHYGLLCGNERKFEQLDAQLEEYEAQWMTERKVEGLYLRLVTRYVNSKAAKAAIAEKSEEYVALIAADMQECRSFKTQFYGRMIEMVHYDSLSDHAGTIRCCEEALIFFDQKSYKSAMARQVFGYNLFVSWFYLRDFERCGQVVAEYGNLFEAGSFNWFKLQEMQLLVELHRGQYESADRIFTETLRHPGFNDLPQPTPELWNIFEAYLHLLKVSAHLNDPATDQRFKINKFRNSVMEFSKDKAGMNIPIIIIQFLLDLSEGKTDECATRAENLAKYRTRYLTGDSAPRTRYFLRMLEQIPKSGFNAKLIQQKTSDIFNALSSSPLEQSDQNHEIEIIPYEVLWGITVGLLSQTASTRRLSEQG